MARTDAAGAFDASEHEPPLRKPGTAHHDSEHTLSAKARAKASAFAKAKASAKAKAKANSG